MAQKQKNEEKLKQKPSSLEETVRRQSGRKKWNYRGVGFVKQVLSREWKREGVMDEQSSESEADEVMGEGIGE